MKWLKVCFVGDKLECSSGLLRFPDSFFTGAFLAFSSCFFGSEWRYLLFGDVRAEAGLRRPLFPECSLRQFQGVAAFPPDQARSSLFQTAFCGARPTAGRSASPSVCLLCNPEAIGARGSESPSGSGSCSGTRSDRAGLESRGSSRAAAASCAGSAGSAPASRSRRRFMERRSTTSEGI